MVIQRVVEPWVLIVSSPSVPTVVWLDSRLAGLGEGRSIPLAALEPGRVPSSGVCPGPSGKSEIMAAAVAGV